MTSKEIKVNISGGRGYSILVGSGIESEIGRAVEEISTNSRTLIVTDVNVARKYLEGLKKALRGTGTDTHAEVLPAGERFKNIVCYRRLIERLAVLDDRRDLIVIAFGGGVVGDMAGFAAATYRRGIPLIQVPTTLLACVDSSVGGKTGFDLPQGKNLVGSFYQPKKVIANMDYLEGLPEREFRAGMAEVIKYGVIMDSTFFGTLERNMIELMNRDINRLVSVVEKCCRLKAKVVTKDEHDKNDVRAILNYGHTFGNAIEAACGYRRYRHGEAVGIGMLCAADLSEKLSFVSSNVAERIEYLVASAGLPISISGASLDALMDFMVKDKKTRGGKLRFVVLDRIGHAFVSDKPEKNEIRSALKKRMSR